MVEAKQDLAFLEVECQFLQSYSEALAELVVTEAKAEILWKARSFNHLGVLLELQAGHGVEQYSFVGNLDCWAKFVHLELRYFDALEHILGLGGLRLGLDLEVEVSDRFALSIVRQTQVDVHVEDDPE